MNEEEQLKMLEEQMAGMDLDGMMKQMLGALNPGAADGSGGDQDDANPFAQMLNQMSQMGMAGPMGGPAGPGGSGSAEGDNAMPGMPPIDAEKIKEAQKMFEDCMTQIQKETDEHNKKSSGNEEGANANAGSKDAQKSVAGTTEVKEAQPTASQS